MSVHCKPQSQIPDSMLKKLICTIHSSSGNIHHAKSLWGLFNIIVLDKLPNKYTDKNSRFTQRIFLQPDLNK